MNRGNVLISELSLEEVNFQIILKLKIHNEAWIGLILRTHLDTCLQPFTKLQQPTDFNTNNYNKCIGVQLEHLTPYKIEREFCRGVVKSGPQVILNGNYRN